MHLKTKKKIGTEVLNNICKGEREPAKKSKHRRNVGGEGGPLRVHSYPPLGGPLRVHSYPPLSLSLFQGLITKQVHHQRASKPNSGPNKSQCQNYQGTLFHLPRFYTERRPKAFLLVHDIIKLLLERPGHRASYDDVKEQLDIGGAAKKLFKTLIFQRFVKGDVRVPYRTLYPTAPESVWKRKSLNVEKNVRVMTLIKETAR